MFRQVEIELEGFAPYSQSRMFEAEALPSETKDVTEKRLWREKMTTDENGIVCIPAMALKQCFDAGAARLGLQIAGRGKTTYTKFFVSDVTPFGDVSLGVHKDEVESIAINAHANGDRSSGTRVVRLFPLIRRWKGTARFALMGDTIPESIFERVVRYSGFSVGIGRFRPEKGGMNGRFKVDEFRWGTLDI